MKLHKPNYQTLIVHPLVPVSCVCVCVVVQHVGHPPQVRKTGGRFADYHKKGERSSSGKLLSVKDAEGIFVIWSQTFKLAEDLSDIPDDHILLDPECGIRHSWVGMKIALPSSITSDIMLEVISLLMMDTTVHAGDFKDVRMLKYAGHPVSPVLFLCYVESHGSDP